VCEGVRVSLLGRCGCVWDIGGEGGERMGDSVICAQVRVDTSKSECLSARMSRSQVFTGEVLLSAAGS
jgi:hypothetical protein